MKKKDDGVGESSDPGLSLFWVDDGLEGLTTEELRTMPRPLWPSVPEQEQTSDMGHEPTMFDLYMDELCVPALPKVPAPVQYEKEDSAIRSVIKTISWRILATAATVLLIYALTDDGDLAMTVGYLDATLKMGLYYFHERIWNRVRVGMTKIRTQS